jgi:hypothetical protein
VAADRGLGASVLDPVAEVVDVSGRCGGVVMRVRRARSRRSSAGRRRVGRRMWRVVRRVRMGAGVWRRGFVVGLWGRGRVVEEGRERRAVMRARGVGRGTGRWVVVDMPVVVVRVVD